MLDEILSNFPSQTHALTLVSDPDGLLADEAVLTALAERGFAWVSETDPVELRDLVEQARPWSVERPLVVVTPGPLEDLPYDLWQQGHRVTLALYAFFPNLAYPVVHALSPAQRSRLSAGPAPWQVLGQNGTMEFVLQQVFDVAYAEMRSPARLIAWFNRYHHLRDPMPASLKEHLADSLAWEPACHDWPLRELLGSAEAFHSFVRGQWNAYLEHQTGQKIGEAAPQYVLRFESDALLQDCVPGLVRSGVLQLITVDRPEVLPRWVLPAVVAPDEDRRPRRMQELVDLLGDYSAPGLSEARWPQWEAVAHLWAELNLLRYDRTVTFGPQLSDRCRELEVRLDTTFLDWLRRRYGPLASQQVPTPHHVYHVPRYIAYLRRQRALDRAALVILDGMSLADWLQIRRVWQSRHAHWRFGEGLLLAQVPTLTAVSRQALVSGLRPSEFASTLQHNRVEGQHWSAFWAREGLPADACAYAALALDREGPPDVLGSARMRALCLVDHSIDDLVHGATMGARQLHSSLELWVEQKSPRLEAVIDDLLAQGFAVYVASDHGHVEAHGIGQPREGLSMDTRAGRARVYSDRLLAEDVQGDCPHTMLWGKDGLLPTDVWALIPEGRSAFARRNEVVVTHGGVTLDEVLVPFVTIEATGSG